MKTLEYIHVSVGTHDTPLKENEFGQSEKDNSFCLDLTPSMKRHGIMVWLGMIHRNTMARFYGFLSHAQYIFHPPFTVQGRVCHYIRLVQIAVVQAIYCDGLLYRAEDTRYSWERVIHCFLLLYRWKPVICVNISLDLISQAIDLHRGGSRRRRAGKTEKNTWARMRMRWPPWCGLPPRMISRVLSP